MINKFEFYHGTVLSRLVHQTDGVSIRAYNEKDNAAYVIDNRIGIYVKYSTKRLTPWRFTFKLDHINVILKLAEDSQDVFVVLVCHDDGICCLSYKEFILVAGENINSVESKWVSAERNKREEYLVKGSNTQLPYKISDSHFPRRILTTRMS